LILKQQELDWRKSDSPSALFLTGSPCDEAHEDCHL
jgi:hypothetical protein